MRCEDFPCCGHEAGCCPDYDPSTGLQLNMKCVCGATVPLTSRVSICKSCLRGDEPYPEDDFYDYDYGYEEEDEYYD